MLLVASFFDITERLSARILSIPVLELPIGLVQQAHLADLSFYSFYQANKSDINIRAHRKPFMCIDVQSLSISIDKKTLLEHVSI